MAMATPDKNSHVKCTNCTGNCCRHYDEVEVYAYDVRRMANWLGLSYVDCDKLVVEQSESEGRQLRKKPDGWCVFHSHRQGCQIYEARPNTCRHYMPVDCDEDKVFVLKSAIKLADAIKE